MNEADQETALRRLFAAPADELPPEPFLERLDGSLHRRYLERLVRALCAASLAAIGAALVHAGRSLWRSGRHLRHGLRAAWAAGRPGA